MYIQQSQSLNETKRRKKIIDYINNNKGCNKESIVHGLEDIISRRPIYRILKQLKNEGVIEEVKGKKNRRDYQLFVDTNNPIIVVTQELEEFEETFFKLYSKTSKEIHSSMLERAAEEIAKNRGWPPGDRSHTIFSTEEMQMMTEDLLLLLYQMADSYLIRSIIVWPKQIQDKNVLNSLYHLVFTKISDILSKLDDKSILSSFMSTSINELEISRRVGAASILKYRGLFMDFGMQKEMEDIMDSMWKSNKDIHKILPSERKWFNSQFNYRSDDWRTLLHNVKQTVAAKERRI